MSRYPSPPSFYSLNLYKRSRRPNKGNLSDHVPTAVIDEHAVTLTIFNIESKREVKCFGFLH